MKMKQMSAVIIGMLSVATAFAEEAQPFDLDFSKVRWVEVTHNRWYGSFGSNGAASLRRSLEGDYEVRAPPGSFSFEEIYALVLPHLKQLPTTNSAGILGIVFYLRDTEPDRKRFYIEDQQVMRTLMYGLRDRAVPNPSSTDGHLANCERLFSRYPLVPGDEPAPFEYDEETRRIARETTVVLKSLIPAFTNAASNDESKGKASRAWSEAAQKYDEKMSKRKLITYDGGKLGMGNPESGIGKEGANRLWLCAGILSALCVGAVIWFIRRKK